MHASLYSRAPAKRLRKRVRENRCCALRARDLVPTWTQGLRPGLSYFASTELDLSGAFHSVFPNRVHTHTEAPSSTELFAFRQFSPQPPTEPPRIILDAGKRSQGGLPEADSAVIRRHGVIRVHSQLFPIEQRFEVFQQELVLENASG